MLFVLRLSSLLPSAQPLQRGKSLSEQAYAALRSSILSGKLAPGDRLIETQLAQSLQVSRTPLREALRQLQREKLVTADPNGGVRVTSISGEDAVQLYDCRIALESLSVAAACEHATDQHLQALQDCLTIADTLTPEVSQLLCSPQSLEVDYQFHHTIALSSENPYLVDLLAQVFDAMTLLRIQTFRQTPTVLEICTEHRRIYEAIVQKDAAKATAAMRAHLTASKARVVESLRATANSKSNL